MAFVYDLNDVAPFNQVTLPFQMKSPPTLIVGKLNLNVLARIVVPPCANSRTTMLQQTLRWRR